MLFRELPAGSLALAKPAISKPWDGPFKFIDYQKRTAVVETDGGPKLFRSSFIKQLRNTKANGLESTYNKDRNTVNGVMRAVKNDSEVAAYAIVHGNKEVRAES